MNSTFRRFASCFCLALAAVCLSGCSDAPFKLYPVKGKVSFADGSKLPGDSTFRTIHFYPNGNEPRSPNGSIADDGTFTLGSIEPGDGAPEGEYTVVISCKSDADYRNGVIKELMIPKYASRTTSPFKVKVPGGDYDFKIEKK